MLSCHVHALYGSTDEHRAFPLRVGSVRVGKVYGSARTLHDLFDIGTSPTDDEQVML